MIDRDGETGPAEEIVLVLQGGGALGAYQAGAYEALAAGGQQPAWLAGISIGAINAAIIAGNPPERRLANLRAFWEDITAWLAAEPWLPGHWARELFSEAGAAAVLALGVPGFFTPRVPPPAFMPNGTPGAISYYDTAPLADTLAALVDFDYLNDAGPRLSVGAVDIETGNFAYFDSNKIRIAPEHIMASGALPPGFPPVTIQGRHYWDGGLVSNTPLQFVLESDGDTAICVFQIDLFSARGELPGNLSEVAQREKDIRYSSRTRLTTDRFRHLHQIGAAARRLSAKLPAGLAADPDALYLRNVGAGRPVTLVHLIHRREIFENETKDYEFTRLSMTEHWAAGKAAVERTLGHRSWQARRPSLDGIQIFDLGSNPDAPHRRKARS